MGWLDATPDKEERPRRYKYVEGDPYLESPFLSTYEQQIISFWFDVGQVSSTSAGFAPLLWSEIKAWADQFYTEQCVEWVEEPTKLRADGRPDKRHKPRLTSVLVKKCILTDWELRLIRQLSHAYLEERNDTTPNKPCPKEVYFEDFTEDDKLNNAKAIKSAFASLFMDNTPAVEAVKNT